MGTSSARPCRGRAQSGPQGLYSLSLSPGEGTGRPSQWSRWDSGAFSHCAAVTNSVLCDLGLQSSPPHASLSSLPYKREDVTARPHRLPYILILVFPLLRDGRLWFWNPLPLGVTWKGPRSEGGEMVPVTGEWALRSAGCVRGSSPGKLEAEGCWCCREEHTPLPA